MEPDRYQQNHFAYISGLICLFLSIGLFAFSLFLLPYLFFSVQYNVPFFIIDFSTILQEKYTISSSGVAWVICFALDFPAVILFVIADVLSNRIDKKIYGIQPTKMTSSIPEQPSPGGSESSGKLIVRIVLLMLIVFIVAQFFHWVVSTNNS
ncbi:MAG: hypothetical protein NTU48_04025 [Legionellales bacterium]|nr:hypothetical protein [Legionellales bacterium]